MTKSKTSPACLIRLLLIRAGVEQNPGPWFCSLCSKKLTSYSVQCSKCNNWLHIKCSGITSKQRAKLKTWFGPCCTSHQPPARPPNPSTSPPPPNTPPPPPPNNPPPPPPNPPPPNQQNNNNSTNVNTLQYNINGIMNKCEELLHYMEKNNIQVAAIQETKLTINSKPKKTPNYTLVRKDRGVNKGGGLAFLVHRDVNFTLEQEPAILEQDQHLESMTICIPGKENNHLYIRNVYIPPQSSCSQGYVPPLNQLYDGLGPSSMVLGDLNAHHELWLSQSTPDTRGNNLVDSISGLNYGIINEDQPTRVTPLASTAPDLSIVSTNIIPYTTWRVENKLSSDHLPIIISLTVELKKFNAQNFTFMNFAKADWPQFKTSTEKAFANARLVRDVHKAEKFFRNTLLSAAKETIPAGRIPKIYNALPTDAARLVETRDDIRNNNPADNRLPDLNREIERLIDDHRLTKWEEHLASCQPSSKQFWDTIKDLGDKPSQPNNQGINFNGKQSLPASKIADNFNKQYTPTSDKKPEQGLRNTLRNMRKKLSDPNIVFTPADTLAAIKKAKNSKAVGPDGLSPIMLKNLGPHGINFLTKIYNKSVNNSIIPSLWKTGKIIPLLKPGKPADQGKSYRPVSILSPPAKILESLLLPYVTESIKLADHQHGFRKGRSTTTALNKINDHINTGLNRKPPVHRTVSVAIDLSRAFDTVDHDLLLKDIKALPLNDHIKRFLCAYLRGRQTYVFFRGTKSSYRKVKQGVPQGGVLSPILFNLYMSSMPAPPGNIVLVSYADDGNLLNSGPIVEPIVQEINIYLSTLDNWFKSRNLFISPSKSSATLFSTFSGDCSKVLDIKIDGELVPTVKKPKILGVTYDNLMSFNQHTADMKTKLQAKNNILKALAGTTWGKEKEVIVNTYKAIGQCTLNYCCPIWTPSIPDSTWNSLQAAQNSALRIATGCHLMTDIQHLHNETKIMPVKEHCEMLSKQFLLSTQRPNHPNRVNLDDPPPPRQMKKTLQSKYGEDIKGLSYPDLPEDVYKSKLKEIHTSSVRKVINLQVNKVLQTKPPAISLTELDLPRRTRTTLAQLRSGYSNFLNSYKARINPEIQDICPHCQEDSHTTLHLFDCQNNPTDLTVTDLWNKPVDVARFLNLPTIYDDNG